MPLIQYVFDNQVLGLNKIKRLMFGASPFTLLRRQRQKKGEKVEMKHQEKQHESILDLLERQQLVVQSDSDSDKSSVCQDLNVFVVTFDKMKQAEKNLAGGDPYQCRLCSAYLNSFSRLIAPAQLKQSAQFEQSAQLKQLSQLLNPNKTQLKGHQHLWVCQFCDQPNILNIQKQEVPKKQDIVYMIQSQLQGQNLSNKDQTMIFCIDVSGSMNTTSQIQGKIDLKFGMSQEEIDMLKQFMQPGDQVQFDWLPGNQNQGKTFISRKQCILSAIQSQLQQIKKKDPMKRVGFVTFNNQVTVLGDKMTETVNIVGDKLYDKNTVIQSLMNFQLKQPLSQSFDNLIDNLNKTQAKGQTALGPALLSAMQIASKGTPGSSIYLCTDGLANIGFGALQPLTEESRKFYDQLAQVAKDRNLSVNIMTIKGQGCKMQVIGKLAQATHGNMKVVNPEKLAEDFANVLKDQVVGVKVQVTIMLHKAMQFRKQNQQSLKEDGRVLLKRLPNATSNSKISFQYQLRSDQNLQRLKVDLQELNEIPFQAQIEYTSPKGGKFLRVITSKTKTTVIEQDLKQAANLGVVHQRVTTQTAALYSQGRRQESQKFNNKWTNFLGQKFQDKEYERKQHKFLQKNMRLQKAIKHKIQKKDKQQKIIEQEQDENYQIKLNTSNVDSDQDQAEFKDNLMQKQNYSFIMDRSDDEEEKPAKKGKN